MTTMTAPLKEQPLSTIEDAGSMLPAQESLESFWERINHDKIDAVFGETKVECAFDGIPLNGNVSGTLYRTYGGPFGFRNISAKPLRNITLVTSRDGTELAGRLTAQFGNDWLHGIVGNYCDHDSFAIIKRTEDGVLGWYMTAHLARTGKTKVISLGRLIPLTFFGGSWNGPISTTLSLVGKTVFEKGWFAKSLSELDLMSNGEFNLIFDATIDNRIAAMFEEAARIEGQAVLRRRIGVAATAALCAAAYVALAAGWVSSLFSIASLTVP